MRKIAAIALALAATPAAAQTYDHAHALVGFQIAETMCGLSIPDDLKLDVIRDGIREKGEDRLKTEIRTAYRMLAIELEQDAEAAFDFCVDMSETFE